MDSAFADLDALNPEPLTGGAAGNPPDGPAATVQEPPAGGAKTPSKAGDGLDPAGKDSTPPATTKPDLKDAAKDGEKPPSGPKELRTAYEQTKAKVVNLEKELATLKEKAAKPAEPGDPKEHPEFKAALARVEAAEKRAEEAAKRAAELDDEIRYHNYEKSSEYQEQYYKPYVRTTSTAIKAAIEMRGVDANGEPRAVTQDEVWAIIANPDSEAALDAAERLYGSPAKAARLAQLRDSVRAASERMEEAKNEFRTKGGERLKAEQAKLEQQTKAEKEMFAKLNEEAAEKFPQFFKPIEGDAKANELLTKGLQRADMAFDENANLTSEQRVKLHSAIRMRAAGFDRLSYLYKQAKDQAAELQKKLDALAKSTPGGGEIAGAGRGSETETWEQDLEKRADSVGRL
jgi:hypothetical protein